MVRGSGKFKQKRGGGRNFSKNMVLDENGTAVSTDKPRRSRREGGSDDEDSENEAVEEEEEEESEESGEEGKPELTRAERRDLKKKQATAKQQTEGDAEDADLINPNHVSKKMNISDLNAPQVLSRREREQKEKQDAKDRYWKLHLAGKTDEAKADLARLANIRAEREAAQAKRKAEAEAKAAELEAKTAAQQAAHQGRRT